MLSQLFQPQMTKRNSTRDLLIAAARNAFGSVGYDGTNSNAIARAAGFAPQTFYRHFADKLEVFLACYALWVDEEIAALSPLADAQEIANALIAHHVTHKMFRRSLRALAASEIRVAKARAQHRLAQLEWIVGASITFASLPSSTRFARLLILERLCDAIADDEAAMLGGQYHDLALEVRIALAEILALR